MVGGREKGSSTTLTMPGPSDWGTLHSGTEGRGERSVGGEGEAAPCTSCKGNLYCPRPGSHRCTACVLSPDPAVTYTLTLYCPLPPIQHLPMYRFGEIWMGT